MTAATAYTSISMPQSTRDKADELMRLEHRKFSHLIAWLIEREYDRRQHPRTLVDEGVGYAVGETVIEEA